MKEWNRMELEELIHQAQNYRNALSTEEEYKKEYQVWGDESFSYDKREAHSRIKRMFENKCDEYNDDPNLTMHIDDDEWEKEMGR